MTKKNVLFVGSFAEAGKDGTVGGQMFACKTLIESSIKNDVNWFLIDSTASTNKARKFTDRLSGSLNRMAALGKMFAKNKIETVLIFSSGGFSMLEKGLMALVSKWLGKTVLFAPRSGFIRRDIENSKFKRAYIRFVLRKVDCVICQGESWRDYYFSFAGGEKEKYAVVHNWIDPKIYLELNAVAKSNDKNLSILFLGWVNRNKGIFDLIDAIELLEDRNFQVIVAGDGDGMNEAVALVKRKKLNEIFEFRGWVHSKEKIELLSSADIFVLPSYKEGYPNSLMEAMASKLPVIATQVGAIPDLVNHDVNGLLFKTGDVHSFAQHISLLLSDFQKRSSLAEAARTRILENNTIEKGVSRFKAVLDTF